MPVQRPAPPAPWPRIRASGKFLWEGNEKFFLHGPTYGPFGPPERNHGLPDPTIVRRDLADMRAWGANALRLYHLPPDWFLETCTELGLRLVLSIPWSDHIDFLRDRRDRRAIHQTVRDAATRLAAWPAVAVLLVGNEIPSSLVRWLGPAQVQAFLEDLIHTARTAAPQTLIGYANFPSTEYLQPANADFASFNLYLEARADCDKYLARLQNLAGDRPLLISEFGVDSLSHGPAQQGQILRWERELCQSHGVAGNLIFSWTDEWFRGGDWVTGWAFGLTARSRTPRPAWHALAGGPPLPAALLGPAPPRVSVIVCTRNGAATLAACLDSLGHLHYPNYEVLLVDDGSTDRVPEIAQDFPHVRYLRLEPSGLSAARNAGAAASTGEILAYTDDDCLADPDWLTYLTKALADPAMVAAGGPNVPPPPQSLVQACIIAAPGGPAHVLLSDRLAEHIPGCNLAVKRSAFDGINGFRPKYHAAGDDVDFCWRLQEAGGGIAFAPAAMVWHHRRKTVAAFLRQQRGYGQAEALLLSRHPGRFGHLGGARWRGVVYHQPAQPRLLQSTGRIYSGRFGGAPFQALYQPTTAENSWIFTSVPWWLLAASLALASFFHPAAAAAAALMLLASLASTAHRAWLLRPDPPWPPLPAFFLLWFLLLAQPLSRGFARLAWNLRLGSPPRPPRWPVFRLPHVPHRSSKAVTELAFWSDNGVGREAFLAALQLDLATHRARPTPDDGWRDWDLEANLGPCWRLRLATVTESHHALGRLTRLRLGSRVTPAWFALQALAAAACAALALYAKIHPLWAVGLFFVWSILCEMRHHRHIARAAYRATATARRTGLLLCPDPPLTTDPPLPAAAPP